VFYRRHVKWVLAYAAGRLRDGELAADVTSEVFAAALLARDRFDPSRAAANVWLFGIVRNQVADAARRGAAERRAQMKLAMEPVPVAAEDVSWIEHSLKPYDGVDLMQLVDELPAEQRAMLSGRVIEERPYAELAREHRVEQAAVRKRVSRALAILRVRIDAAGVQR
jgi:RNA polymerase sigma-70 factor (ECF subfamily)